MSTRRPLLLAPIVSLVAAGAMLLVTGCGSSSTSTGASGSTSTGSSGSTQATAGATGTTAAGTARADLTGTTWQLETYQGPTGPVPAAAPTPLTFGPAGALSGSAGCNRITGRYTARAGELTLDLGAMTQMACADPAVDAQEQAVVAALAQVRGFAVEGDQLTLTSATGTPLLVYRSTPTGLAGTSWKGRGLNNGRDALETNALTENLTLRFEANGTSLGGFDGCNDFGGTYTTAEPATSLTISVQAATTRACADDVMAVASQYLAALGRVATYEREANRLTLRDATGAMQATFTAA